MKKNNLLFVCLICLLFTNCLHDEPNSVNNDTPKTSLSFNKELGVLKFNNIANLKSFIDSYDSNKSDITTFYDNGFIPYEPLESIGDKRYAKLIKDREKLSIKDRTLSSLYKKGGYDENYDEEDDRLIKNDKFSSLLNAKGEIQINDSIYRYTANGVYIINEKNKEELDKYLLNNSTIENTQSSGLHYINNHIKLYKPKHIDFTIDIPEGEKNSSIYSRRITKKNHNHNHHSVIKLPENTDNYNTCVNQKASWVDNIFGKSYVCEYYFTGKRKLRTTFAVEDYYIYTDIYAQAKFKQKTWFGWFSCRDADKVYLKINQANLSFTERRLPLKISFTTKQVEKLYSDIESVIKNTAHKVAIFISNSFTKDNNIVSEEEYFPSLSELGSSAESFEPIVPVEHKPKFDVSFDFSEFFNEDVKKVIVITAMGKDLDVKNTTIIKKAYDLFESLAPKYERKDPIGLIILQHDIDSKNVMVSDYSVSNEVEQVQGYAVASRTFKIPQKVKINELSIGIGSNLSGEKKIGIGIDVSWRKVDKFALNLEAGALFSGQWGGSKFIVTQD